ncbi:hypothetical protein [Bremerella volcania]|nr:hypothetical protein [Bremerella volcania]
MMRDQGEAACSDQLSLDVLGKLNVPVVDDAQFEVAWNQYAERR